MQEKSNKEEQAAFQSQTLNLSMMDSFLKAEIYIFRCSFKYELFFLICLKI